MPPFHTLCALHVTPEDLTGATDRIREHFGDKLDHGVFLLVLSDSSSEENITLRLLFRALDSMIYNNVCYKWADIVDSNWAYRVVGPGEEFKGTLPCILHVLSGPAEPVLVTEGYRKTTRYLAEAAFNTSRPSVI